MVTEAAPAETVVTPPTVEAPSPVLEVTEPTAPVQVPSAVEPVATKPAEPPVTPASVVPPEVQQYITRLEQQNQLAQQQTERQVLDTTVAQLAQRLAQEAATEYGITPEQALPFVQRIAKQQGDILYSHYTEGRFRQGQFNAAFEIGKQHGVDPRILMNLPTPEAMIAAAQQASGQSKADARVAALEAEIAKLKKASVPAQTFASGTVGGDGGRITKDNIDGLYMKDPERYGDVYRKFLRTSQI